MVKNTSNFIIIINTYFIQWKSKQTLQVSLRSSIPPSTSTQPRPAAVIFLPFSFPKSVAALSKGGDVGVANLRQLCLVLHFYFLAHHVIEGGDDGLQERVQRQEKARVAVRVSYQVHVDSILLDADNLELIIETYDAFVVPKAQLVGLLVRRTKKRNEAAALAHFGILAAAHFTDDNSSSVCDYDGIQIFSFLQYALKEVPQHFESIYNNFLNFYIKIL